MTVWNGFVHDLALLLPHDCRSFMCFGSPGAQGLNITWGDANTGASDPYTCLFSDPYTTDREGLWGKHRSDCDSELTDRKAAIGHLPGSVGVYNATLSQIPKSCHEAPSTQPPASRGGGMGERR